VTALRLAEPPNDRELEILKNIIAQGANGEPPHLSTIARDFGVTRQAVHYWVKRLRAKGLLEEGPGNGPKEGLLLTHNGKLAVADSEPPPFRYVIVGR
jgi:predicted transcriptional regulator